MKKIELERRKADLTQQQLAELVGVTSGAVSKWEQGVTIPRSDRLVIVADVLGVKVEDLIGEAE